MPKKQGIPGMLVFDLTEYGGGQKLYLSPDDIGAVAFDAATPTSAYIHSSGASDAPTWAVATSSVAGFMAPLGASDFFQYHDDPPRFVRLSAITAIGPSMYNINPVT
jgi:hypothetical protein